MRRDRWASPLCRHGQRAEVVYQTTSRRLSGAVGAMSATRSPVSPRLPTLLDYSGNAFDIVLVDPPPSGVIIDAAEIANPAMAPCWCQYNSVRRRELGEARRQIERAGCPILGAVLNEVPMDSYSNRRYYNQGYYSQYYSSTSGSSSSLSRSSASRKRRKNG